MITQQEAEALATQKIQEYIALCKCDTVDDVGNALMKMVSVTGQAILATQGQNKAVMILEATAAHLAKPEFKHAYKMEKLN